MSAIPGHVIQINAEPGLMSLTCEGEDGMEFGYTAVLRSMSDGAAPQWKPTIIAPAGVSVDVARLGVAIGEALLIFGQSQPATGFSSPFPNSFLSPTAEVPAQQMVIKGRAMMGMLNLDGGLREGDLLFRYSGVMDMYAPEEADGHPRLGVAVQVDDPVIEPPAHNLGNAIAAAICEFGRKHPKTKLAPARSKTACPLLTQSTSRTAPAGP